ncbi:MAG: DUF3185 family protein [Parachlamydiales bacterium]|nr:DUF3185 family protein [Parachlamydiales bacterium]
MSVGRILALVLLIVGVILLVFGINASQSVTENVMESATGRFTDKTMWYIIGGVVMIIFGGAIAVFGRKKG